MRSFALLRAREPNYPGGFQEIKQHIGEEAGAKLAAQYGGTRLYIPATLQPEHPICQLLGQESAQLLANEFGGLTLEIPRNVALYIAQRNAMILHERAIGTTQRQLAIKYHLTERTIRNILNSTSEQPK